MSKMKKHCPVSATIINVKNLNLNRYLSHVLMTAREWKSIKGPMRSLRPIWPILDVGTAPPKNSENCNGSSQ